MSIKTGDIINEYCLKIYENSKVEKNKDTHTVIAIEEHVKRGQVIAMTDDYHGIEVLQTVYDKDGMSTPINKSIIWESNWRSKTLTDSVQATIYTTKKDEKKVYENLKKDIAKFIDKKYGKYCSYKIFLENIEI